MQNRSSYKHVYMYIHILKMHMYIVERIYILEYANEEGD